jgi:hypothetical protein
VVIDYEKLRKIIELTTLHCCAEVGIEHMVIVVNISQLTVPTSDGGATSLPKIDVSVTELTEDQFQALANSVNKKEGN